MIQSTRCFNTSGWEFFLKLEGLIPIYCHTDILIILFLWCPAVTRVVDSGCVYVKLCCSRSLEMYLSIERDLHVCCTEYISITNFKFRWFLESWHTTVTIHLMYHHLLFKCYFIKLKYDRYKGLAILSVLKLVWVWCSYLILLLAVNIFAKIRLLFCHPFFEHGGAFNKVYIEVKLLV